MKTAILAGGAGSRLADETRIKPKPMVEIGGRPVLWHIMKHYAHFGFGDFVIALGYKGEAIKEYFEGYRKRYGNVRINLKSGDVEYENSQDVDWIVHLVETGQSTQTGGRIKRLAPFLGNETFMLTWGDGLSDVNLGDLVDFHRSHGKLATLTAVRPPARYGHLAFDGDRVREFSEKPQTAEGWINGAFFVLEPGVFDYIEGDQTQWEREPLQRLAEDGELMAFRHTSFWQCMDTLREKHILEQLWAGGHPPWRTWE